MTKEGRRTRLRSRITPSKPHSVQYSREPTGGGAGTGKTNRPPGRSAAWAWAKRPGRSAGRKCPNAPKLTARSKAEAKGRARASARTQSTAGPGRGSSPNRAAASASMPALKSTPVTRSSHTCRSTPTPAPVPQQRSTPVRNGPSGRTARVTASSTRSGVRNGVWSNLGASRS